MAHRSLSETLHVGDDGPYQSHEFLQRWDEWQRRSHLSDMENYINGDVEFLFDYSRQGQACQAKAVPHKPAKRPLDVDAVGVSKVDPPFGHWEIGGEAAQMSTIQATVICRRDQGAVLVRGVPAIQQIEKIVPTWFTVRPQAHDEIEELWGHPLGQSVFHSFLKPSRRFGEGELDSSTAPFVGNMGRNDLPIGMVERASESLEGVTSDQGGLIYDGFVLFSVGGTLIGFGICFENVFEGLLFAEQFIELSDVFWRPYQP